MAAVVVSVLDWAGRGDRGSPRVHASRGPISSTSGCGREIRRGGPRGPPGAGFRRGGPSRLRQGRVAWRPDHSVLAGRSAFADRPGEARQSAEGATAAGPPVRYARCSSHRVPLGYVERVLRAEEDTFAVARYLLGNPVRSGLVESPEEFPFLGSLTMGVHDILESVQASDRRTFRSACRGPAGPFRRARARCRATRTSP